VAQKTNMWFAIQAGSATKILIESKWYQNCFRNQKNTLPSKVVSCNIHKRMKG